MIQWEIHLVKKKDQKRFVLLSRILSSIKLLCSITKKTLILKTELSFVAKNSFLKSLIPLVKQAKLPLLVTLADFNGLLGCKKKKISNMVTLLEFTLQKQIC